MLGATLARRVLGDRSAYFGGGVAQHAPMVWPTALTGGAPRALALNAPTELSWAALVMETLLCQGTPTL